MFGFNVDIMWSAGDSRLLDQKSAESRPLESISYEALFCNSILGYSYKMMGVGDVDPFLRLAHFFSHRSPPVLTAVIG